MDKSLSPAGDASNRSTGSSDLQPRGTDLLRVLGDAAVGCLACRHAP